MAGIWAAVGIVVATSPAGSTSTALGLFLIVGGVAMWAPAAAAAASKTVPALVLATAGLRFLLTGWYELSSVHAVEVTAGVVGQVATLSHEPGVREHL